jgi:hypothetical protein
MRNQPLAALPPIHLSSASSEMGESGAPARESVPRRQHRAVGVVEQVHAFDGGRSEVGQGGVVVDDRQVELTVGQPLMQVRHVVVHDDQAHCWVLLLEPGQNGRQEGRQCRGERAQAQATAASTRQRCHLLLGGVQARDHGPCVPRQNDAGFGELGGPTRAIDDRLTQGAFERGDVLADRRLGHAERVRSGGEGTAVRDLDEHAEPAYLSH